MSIKNTNDFKSRFERWKNGESYWDIVGKPLPGQNKPEQLSDEQKAELDNYVRSITSYDNGKSQDGYYDYMEKLAANKAKEWKQGYDQTLLEMLNDNTYNYRAMYDKYGGDDTKHEGHFTDEFKTSYHPTFSNLSMYSGAQSQYNPMGIEGGIWTEDGDYYANDRTWSPGFNVENTNRYLKVAEDIPMGRSRGIRVKYGKPLKYQDGKDDYRKAFVLDMYERNKRNAEANGDSYESARYRTLQNALESQYGQSRLATEQHNYGGVKKPGKDNEYATYENRDDYVDKSSDLLRRKYHALNTTSLEEYMDSLEAGGYYDLRYKDQYRKTMRGMRSAMRYMREKDQQPSDYIKRKEPTPIKLPAVQDMRVPAFESSSGILKPIKVPYKAK